MRAGDRIVEQPVDDSCWLGERPRAWDHQRQQRAPRNLPGSVGGARGCEDAIVQLQPCGGITVKEWESWGQVARRVCTRLELQRAANEGPELRFGDVVGGDRPRWGVGQVAELVDLQEASAAEPHRLGIDDLRDPFERESVQQRRAARGEGRLDDGAFEPHAAVKERRSGERLLDRATIVLRYAWEEGREIEERRSSRYRVGHRSAKVLDKLGDKGPTLCRISLNA